MLISPCVTLPVLSQSKVGQPARGCSASPALMLSIAFTIKKNRGNHSCLYLEFEILVRHSWSDGVSEGGWNMELHFSASLRPRFSPEYWVLGTDFTPFALSELLVEDRSIEKFLLPPHRSGFPAQMFVR